MMLLTKKAGGLVLVLLGGLILAHGASTGWMWENVAGLLLLALGVALLALKIVRRHSPTGGGAKH
jgi:hypothetical protein